MAAILVLLVENQLQIHGHFTLSFLFTQFPLTYYFTKNILGHFPLVKSLWALWTRYIVALKGRLYVNNYIHVLCQGVVNSVIWFK